MKTAPTAMGAIAFLGVIPSVIPGVIVGVIVGVIPAGIPGWAGTGWARAQEAPAETTDPEAAHPEAADSEIEPDAPEPLDPDGQGEPRAESGSENPRSEAGRGEANPNPSLPAPERDRPLAADHDAEAPSADNESPNEDGFPVRFLPSEDGLLLFELTDPSPNRARAPIQSRTRRLCDGECLIRLGAGPHLFALARPGGHPERGEAPVLVESPGELQGRYEDRGETRDIGAAILLGGVLSGLALIVSGAVVLSSGEEGDEGLGAGGGLVIAGAFLSLAATPLGLWLSIHTDEAHFEFSPTPSRD